MGLNGDYDDRRGNILAWIQMIQKAEKHKEIYDAIVWTMEIGIDASALALTRHNMTCPLQNNNQGRNNRQRKEIKEKTDEEEMNQLWYAF